MQGSSISSRLSRVGDGQRAPQWVDDATAAALALGAVAQALTVDRPGGERLALVVGVLLMTIPLRWRRQHPLAVAGVVAAGLAGTSALTEAPESIWALVAFVVTSYSVAAYAPLRRALLAALLVSAGISIAILRDPSDSASNIAPTLFAFVAVPWLAGRALHSRDRVTSRLRERTAELERDRELMAQAAAAHERLRIARELHDVVAHGLSVVAIQADAAAGALETRPEVAVEALEAVRDAARESLAETRRLLGVLRESEDGADLPPDRGLADLPGLTERVTAAGLRVESRTEGHPRSLDPDVEMAAYRLVQEALTNVLKHAGPAEARLLLLWADDTLTIEISDDGRAGSGGSDGYGLRGMRERIGLYGGTIDVGSVPDAGFRVRATLPTLAR